MPDAFCLDQGLLVGMKERLPDDPRAYYRERSEIIGCNRVFCRLCRSPVRHVDDRRIIGFALDDAEHVRLYETLDPSGITSLGPGFGQFRTYLCRCQWADSPSLKVLGYGDIDGWACAGHEP